jgi:hypothetical protein
MVARKNPVQPTNCDRRLRKCDTGPARAERRARARRRADDAPQRPPRPGRRGCERAVVRHGDDGRTPDGRATTRGPHVARRQDRVRFIAMTRAPPIRLSKGAALAAPIPSPGSAKPGDPAHYPFE